MGHESHVEKRLSRIPGDVVPVKNIKRAVVAGRQDESATGHCGSELHRVGCLQHPLAAQPDGLPKEQARSVKLRRLRSGLLKLEVLNGAPESANLREPSLRNHLRDEVRLGTGPEPQPKEKREGGREASFGVGHERVDTAVGVRVRSLKRQLPGRNVCKLAIKVPALVIQVVPAVM